MTTTIGPSWRTSLKKTYDSWQAHWDSDSAHLWCQSKSLISVWEIKTQKTFGLETDRPRDYLDFIAGKFHYGRKASVADMKRDAQMAEMYKSNSTSGLLAQAHFSPALLIQDAWSNREGDKEALAIMLASTCIAHASSSERITQLSRGASKEDSSNKAIRICELRGGAYYRAFILGLRDNQVSYDVWHVLRIWFLMY